MAVPELQRIEGKFEILDKIREGGMGAIYKVRHRLLDEVRVIKVIRPQLGEDESLRERFLAEAKSTVRLRHPNIATIFDFTVDEDGVAFMVMEYIEGEDLARKLARMGRLQIAQTMTVSVQALKALHYLHRSNFVHRDVSPDNIMVTKDVDDDDLVKLIDLGIAKQLESDATNLTQEGFFLGKIKYASPEQFGGRGELDGRSDLYSFGVMLYELLTGMHPFPADSQEAMLAGHLFHPPREFTESDPDARIPEELRQIVLRALAKERDDRFQTAKDMAQAIQKIRRNWVDPEPVDEGSNDATILEPMPSPLPPGSTQRRLDRQFAPATTPPPIQAVEDPPGTPAGTSAASPGTADDATRLGAPPSAGRSAPAPDPTRMAPSPGTATPGATPPADATRLSPGGAPPIDATRMAAPPAADATQLADARLAPAPRHVPAPETAPAAETRRGLPWWIPVAALFVVGLGAGLFFFGRGGGETTATDSMLEALEDPTLATAGAGDLAAGLAGAQAALDGDRYRAALQQLTALEANHPDEPGIDSILTALDGKVRARHQSILERATTLESQRRASRVFGRADAAAKKGDAALAQGDLAASVGAVLDATSLLEEANEVAEQVAADEAAAQQRQEEQARQERERLAQIERERRRTASQPAPVTQTPQRATETAPQEAAPQPAPSQQVPSQRTATPPPTTPAPQKDETPAVAAAIQRLAAAHTALDINAVKAVWPSLGGSRLQAIENSFQGARSIVMSLDGCNITVNGERATASCKMRQAYRPKRGTRQSIERDVTIRLRKTGSSWVVEDY